MDPTISSLNEKDGMLTFTLEGCNVSLANAVRRTILSDIPTVVFKTFPHEANMADIQINTTRLNNEIIKQRLGCIPIHITDLSIPFEDYEVIIDKYNETDTIEFVTTEDFIVRNLKTDTELKKAEIQKIFPPNSITNHFIDFVRLSPKISSEVDGSRLRIVAKMSVSNAKDDAMYNVVSTCTYKNTIDKIAMNEKAQEYEEKLRTTDMTDTEIQFEKQNWKLLEGKRICVENSYDFTVETVGVFENRVIVQKACDIIIEKLTNLINEANENYISITESQDTTMTNSFTITLKNEDYTIGKILEYMLYQKRFHGDKTLAFVGFRKEHPHDTDSIIRIAFKKPTDEAVLRQNIHSAVEELINIYSEIKKPFMGELTGV